MLLNLMQLLHCMCRALGITALFPNFDTRFLDTTPINSRDITKSVRATTIAVSQS